MQLTIKQPHASEMDFAHFLFVNYSYFKRNQNYNELSLHLISHTPYLQVEPWALWHER